MELSLSSDSDSDDGVDHRRPQVQPRLSAADLARMTDEDWEYENQAPDEALARAAAATVHAKGSTGATPGTESENHMLFTPYVTEKIGTKAFPARVRDGDTVHVVKLAPHPSPLVEPSSLSGVLGPDPTYLPHLPVSIFRSSPPALSAAQFETIVYAGQRHSQLIPGTTTRCGFFLGDGTGVGKGRQCAAMIYDAWRKGRRRSVWISVSNDLYHDAMRDFNDLHFTSVECFEMRDYDLGDDIEGDGVAFCTYAMLIQGRGRGAGGSSSSSSSGSSGVGGGAASGGSRVGAVTRLDQLIDWLGRGEAEGTIVFDESHKCKNLVDSASTQTARAVNTLQEECPDARIVYASATGASDARHLAFMSRLGLWGPGTAHANYKAFEVAIIGARGTFRRVDMMGRMEMVAIELKAIGMYCVRSLSWVGTEFDVVTVHPTAAQRDVYDAAARLWQRLLVDIDQALAKQKIMLHDEVDDDDAAGLAKARSRSTSIGSMLRSQLWSAHQQFFRQMLLALKSSTVGRIAREHMAAGLSPVVALWSTGESRTSEVMRRFAADEALGEGGTPEDFAGVSVAVEIVTRLLRWMTAPKGCALPLDADRYIRGFRSIGLPLNPIEKIIGLVGGYKVCAELTGRSDKLIARRAKGGIGKEPGAWRKCFKKRNWGTCADGGALGGRARTSKQPAEPNASSAKAVAMSELNMYEKRAFMRGAKRAALITEAASNGISLHADVRAANQARRVMICTELPWAADKCLQQFGRVHRSNQRCPPKYILVVTDAAGESRFVSQIARRLATMGALTRGDRRASSGAFGSADVFEKANYMDSYGDASLRALSALVFAESRGENPRTVLDNQCYGILPDGVISLEVVAEEELLSAAGAQGSAASAAAEGSAAAGGDERDGATASSMGASDEADDVLARRRIAAASADDVESFASRVANATFAPLGYLATHMLVNSMWRRVVQFSRESPATVAALVTTCSTMWENAAIRLQLDEMRRLATYAPPVHLEDFCATAAKAMASVGMKTAAKLHGDGARGRALAIAAGKSSARIGFARFTNRLLGLSLAMQSKLFDYFVELYDASVKHAQNVGTFNPGVDDIKSIGGIKLKKTEVVHRDEATGAETTMCELETDEGLPWDKAKELYEKRRAARSPWDPLFGNDDGFYLWRPTRPWTAKKMRPFKEEVVLVMERRRLPPDDGLTVNYRGQSRFRFWFPHRAPENEYKPVHTLSSRQHWPAKRWAIVRADRLTKVRTADEAAKAKLLWTGQFELAEEACTTCHQCRARGALATCTLPNNTRLRRWVLLSGRLLTIWDCVQDVYGAEGAALRVYRAKASDYTESGEAWRVVQGGSVEGEDLLPVVGEFFCMYRYILRESCSQFDSLPLTSLTISGLGLLTDRMRRKNDIVSCDLLLQTLRDAGQTILERAVQRETAEAAENIALRAELKAKLEKDVDDTRAKRLFERSKKLKLLAAAEKRRSDALSVGAARKRRSAAAAAAGGDGSSDSDDDTVLQRKRPAARPFIIPRRTGVGAAASSSVGAAVPPRRKRLRRAHTDSESGEEEEEEEWNDPRADQDGSQSVLDLT
jgi:hypothetical protein